MLPKVGEGSSQPELFSVLVASQLLQKTPRWGKSPPGPAYRPLSSPSKPHFLHHHLLKKSSKGESLQLVKKIRCSEYFVSA